MRSAPVVRHVPRGAIIAVATILSACAGCRCQSGCCLPRTPRIACNLPEGPRADAPPDLMRLVPDCEAEDCRLAPLPSPSETYRLLTPGDCQCRAAANATIANMLELEEHWATVTIECDSKVVAKNLCLQRDLLELHAADVRNKSAAAALEAYYQLAALEARARYLDLAVEELTKSRDRVAKLRNEGLPVEVDGDEIAIQLAALEDRRLQLEFARVQLNGQLQKLMGCPIAETDFFWPEVDWTPDLSPLDAEAELQAALPDRFDVRGVGLILCKLEKSTLRVARGVLAVADSTLGSVEPTEGWVHRVRCIACSGFEVDVRCRQLAMLYEETERLATAEIKSAVYEATMQQRRIAVARQAVQQRRERLYELDAKRDPDDTSIFEISRARSRLYDAEATLVEQVAGLSLARVRLRKAQAALAAECGFVPKLCCEGCCDGECLHCRTRTCCAGELPCRCEKCCRK